MESIYDVSDEKYAELTHNKSAEEINFNLEVVREQIRMFFSRNLYSHDEDDPLECLLPTTKPDSKDYVCRAYMDQTEGCIYFQKAKGRKWKNFNEFSTDDLAYFAHCFDKY